MKFTPADSTLTTTPPRSGFGDLNLTEFEDLGFTCRHCTNELKKEGACV